MSHFKIFFIFYLFCIDRDELDMIIAQFNAGETSYFIQPDVLKSANIPDNIDTIILAIKPFQHSLLSIGDTSETEVILIS